MSKLPEFLKSEQNRSDLNSFIVEVRHCADRAETHVAFEGETPDYVSKAEKLRRIAGGLEVARDAAAGGDKGKVKELKSLWAEAQLCLDINAFHISLLSFARNDRSILHNAGYELRQKPGRNKPAVNLLDITPELSVKHLAGVSGGIVVKVKRIKRKNASVEIQMTDQDPKIEASWYSKGIHNKSRIEYRGLQPITKIYIRTRYHADGCTGQWSSVVGIVII